MRVLSVRVKFLYKLEQQIYILGSSISFRNLQSLLIDDNVTKTYFMSEPSDSQNFFIFSGKVSARFLRLSTKSLDD